MIQIQIALFSLLSRILWKFSDVYLVTPIQLQVKASLVPWPSHLLVLSKWDVGFTKLTLWLYNVSSRVGKSPLAINKQGNLCLSWIVNLQGTAMQEYSLSICNGED